ncbi:MAG: DUF503 domain-containing protein [Tissierellia bacterium]|nr:DUF503 domain-containing protein [Tissierellia bacterium]
MKALAIEYRLRLFSVDSLKEKRKIRQSLIKRLQNKFHISVAETGEQDSFHVLVIAVALVSNDYTFLRKQAAAIESFLCSYVEFELLDVEQIQV